jgi:hypothetical protein
MQLASSESIRYRDFVLAVRSEAGRRFYGRVQSSPAGETGEFPLRFSVSVEEIEEALASVTYTSGNYLKRSNSSGSYDSILQLGERLFQELMRDTVVGRMFRQAQEQLASRYEGLRLRIVAQDPGVLRLPWEFLFDAAQSNFLALSLFTPLIRMAAPATPLTLQPVSEPLRLLVVTAEITDFDAEEEIALLQQLQGQNGSPTVRVLANATYTAFQEVLRAEQPHIVHFITTGAYGAERGYWSKVKPTDDANASQGLLFMGATARYKDPLANAEFIPAAELTQLFRDQPAVRFVMLNACNTDLVAAELAQVIPAVLGIRMVVLNATCQALARGLYEGLVAGQSLEAAVTAGRQMVDRLHPGTREWGLPTFYMHAPDGFLLAPPPQAASASLSLSIDPLLTPSPARALETTAPPGTMRELRRLQVQLDLEVRNLESLRAQQATMGTATPDYIRTQLLELEEKVAQLQARLQAMAQ